MAKRSDQFERFDHAMEELLKVPHSEIKKKLDAEKEAKRKRKAASPRGFRYLNPLPKICCPVCNADIDVSRAKYSEPLSICHGQVVVTPVPETLVGTVDFYISQPDNEGKVFS